MARTVIFPTQRSRRGIALVELLASVAVTTVLLGGMAFFTVKMWEEMAAARCRDGVAHWACNVMEQAQNPNLGQPLETYFSTLKLPAHLAKQMVQPKIKAQVSPVEGHPDLHRLDLDVQWVDPNGSPAGPVRLSTLAAKSGKDGRTS